MIQQQRETITEMHQRRSPVADSEIPNDGPRVTPADIEANIASEHYFTAQRGVEGTYGGCEQYVCAMERGEAARTPVALSLLTFCVLVLRNGFTVTGESACASPENFREDIGNRIARESAVRKIWPLLGFRLRDRLCAEAYANEPSYPETGSLI